MIDKKVTGYKNTTDDCNIIIYSKLITIFFIQ